MFGMLNLVTAIVVCMLVMLCTADGEPGTQPTSPAIILPLTPPQPASPSVGAPSDLGQPATTVPGQVSVLMAPSAYAEGNVIQVTVTNGLGSTIYANDEKTDCSIVTLEQWTGDAWEPIMGCGLRRSPATIPIGSGRGRDIQIDPASSNFGRAPGELGFGAGTYRITFTYRLDPARGAAEPYSVSSASFNILPNP
jgi:hypothetical protein